jgi:ectoine hydroxylase
MASSAAAEYAEAGFVFRPELLRADEVRVLTDELERILAGGEPAAMILFETDGVTPRTVVNPHLYSDVFDRLLRHPALLGAVEGLLGEQVYAFQLGVNCKAAFNGDVWFWHQDYPTYLEDDHIAEPRMVNVLVFLDEVSALNAPLMLVPTSHRLTPEVNEETTQNTSYKLRYSSTELIQQEVARCGVIAPTGPPGSTIFMHVNCLHGSTANLSPWSRRMVTLTYNAMSNKATAPTVRSRAIVYDDADLPALQPLAADCLVADR